LTLLVQGSTVFNDFNVLVSNGYIVPLNILALR